MLVKDLNPLRLIRISKNIEACELAEILGVSRSYVSQIENGIKPDNDDFISNGLCKIGITPADYKELKDFCNDLKITGLSESEKYRFALIKALGISSQAIRFETEALLNTYLVPNITEITTYITMAQNYNVIVLSDDVIVIEKDDNSKKEDCLNSKYLSLKKIGISYEDYRYLNDKFSKVNQEGLSNISHYKLLLTLSVLYPESKEKLENIADNYLKNINKVKEKKEF